LPPASQSNFESLAIDASALPRQKKRNEQKSTRASQRSNPHCEHAQGELSLASMVLFDSLALDAACCPQGRRNATHQAVNSMVAEQANAWKQNSEVGITLHHILSSFVPPNRRTKGFDQGGACRGSSDSTMDQDVVHIHTISDLRPTVR